MSKKNKKGKLPKRIAGIKLSKRMRKQAEKAIAELKQPIVREVIANAMGMAASAMAKQAALRPRSSDPDLQTALKRNPAARSEAVNPAAGKSGGEQFAEIATELAVIGLGKLFERMQVSPDVRKTGPDA